MRNSPWNRRNQISWEAKFFRSHIFKVFFYLNTFFTMTWPWAFKTNKKCLCWVLKFTKHLSLTYFIQTNFSETKNKGRFSISCWKTWKKLPLHKNLLCISSYKFTKRTIVKDKLHQHPIFTFSEKTITSIDKKH